MSIFSRLLKVLAFVLGGFSLRGPYSKILDRLSANQNASFHRIPDLEKIKEVMVHNVRKLKYSKLLSTTLINKISKATGLIRT